MTESNELQPKPETELQAAEVQAAPAPETPETQAEENIPESAPAEEPAPVEEVASPEEPAPAEEAPVVLDGSPAEEAPVEEATSSEEEPARPVFETKEAVVDRLREIEAEGNGGEKNELDLLKQVFYKLHKAAQMAARNAFIESGGAPEDWRAEIDGAEENFKAIMNNIRQRRAEIAEALERQKAENLEKKQAIIERIKELATSPEPTIRAHFL